MKKALSLLLLLIHAILTADMSVDELMQALEIADYWDRKQNERFPITYNHLLSGGYFVTHSARMSQEGTIGIGVAHTPPYFNWNGRIQPFPFLEFGLNYRIFRGCEDSVLSKYGFGDYADRGANFKFALSIPEVHYYELPGICVGVDDFMGSKKFVTYYIVGTQVWPEQGLETSLGWGTGRYTRGPSRGFFGGVNWFFLSSCENKWIKGACLTAEFDPTNYSKDPHPEGRRSHAPINVGAKYTLCDVLELSVGYLRGETFAAAGSLNYSWGRSLGFIPKIDDPLPYTAPVDSQPLGCMRNSTLLVESLKCALKDQGFQLTKVWLAENRLGLRLINCRYRLEECVRMRLQFLLAALTPSNIETVVVQLESEGLPCQQYVYQREHLLRYAHQCMSPFEMDVLSPRQEVSVFPPGEQIFAYRPELWRIRFGPRLENFFGSARGKYKYDLGVKVDLEGFLPCNWSYELQLSTTVFSDIKKISDCDIFSPSQLLNVATDYIRYRQAGANSCDRLYLQKNWNFGKGCFGRIAGGYFQINYGGVAAEVLWYPANSLFAIGLEGAVVKKREYTGLGFQSKIRHFEGRRPVWERYFTLQQYFLDLYFDLPAIHIFSKISIGQFLARDVGARVEVTRYFDNGIRFTGWMTYTNAHDRIHEKNYYDRGVALEIPFDLFYKRSSRRVWNYAAAAWLRDAGYVTKTGRTLFETLNRERR